MKHDPEMIERVAKGIYERHNKGLKNIWPWDSSGLDDEHPGSRDYFMSLAQAALDAAFEWQPIETAPVGPILVRGVCQTALCGEGDDVDEPAIHHVWRGEDGRCDVLGTVYYSAWVNDPTHWLPIPTPPEED